MEVVVFTTGFVVVDDEGGRPEGQAVGVFIEFVFGVVVEFI